MRSCFLVMVVLGVGCATDGDAPSPTSPTTHVQHVTELHVALEDDGEADVCTLAEELPLDDICSLICDPSAMATRMIEDGSDRGACYQLYCALPGDAHVLVGVCLPP